ncbi:MAG: histidine--tRNA ligase [Bacteroidota bacterium]
MKPSIPKGTRDFLPPQVLRREYIFSVLRRAFQRYGYQPIETPALENLSTLTGKYGEEGDRLLFKVLNNGDYLSKADESALATRDSEALTSSIAKRGLRYDLTVPFARYVVMHQNDLSFPFKRYAIQPVWRADRPQKGRYQEFYQCDADVVGSDSLIYEAEQMQLFDRVFAELGLRVQIRINHRRILVALSELAGHADKMMDITMAIDKLDKIGLDGVKRELTQRGIPEDAQGTIEKFLAVESLDELEALVGENENGQVGVSELREVFDMYAATGSTNPLIFDVKLARGLNYYTGCIFEVEVDTEAHPGIKMGSIASGGRYADLTEVFGMKNQPGVGISFGAERIYDVLEELDLFPGHTAGSLAALVLCMDKMIMPQAFQLVSRLRASGIHADLYPKATKLGKMMKYADQRGVPKVILLGSEEAASGVYSLKDMASGEQEKLDFSALLNRLKID